MASADCCLMDVPIEFANAFHFSARNLRQALHYAMEGYGHDVVLKRDRTSSDDIKLSAACYRSQSKSEKPQKLSLTISFTKKLSPKLFARALQGKSLFCHSHRTNY